MDIQWIYGMLSSGTDLYISHCTDLRRLLTLSRSMYYSLGIMGQTVPLNLYRTDVCAISPDVAKSPPATYTTTTQDGAAPLHPSGFAISLHGIIFHGPKSWL
jgi:hypothetical protein